jgi:hypothetical protein
MKKPPDWSGQTVVCIGSGPSLTHEDCDLVRDSNYWTVAINNSVMMAPWAHALYAGDRAWWDTYWAQIQWFDGERYAYNTLAREHGAITLANCPWFASPGNSGAGALRLAMLAGADRIILIGYDCSIANGMHWHGPHQGSLSNCQSIKRWPAQFKALADDANQQGIQIINASRATALECFDRMDLEDAL